MLPIPGPCAARCVCGVLMAAALLVEGGMGQVVPPVLTARAHLADYGVGSLDEVRRGRVSVAYTRDGAKLAVYFLRTTRRPAAEAPREEGAGEAPVQAEGSGGADASPGEAGAAGVPARITLPAEADPPGEPVPVRGGESALWVWNTRALLDDAHERGAFLDFVEARGISRVFLYLAAEAGERPRAGYVPFDRQGLGDLAEALHRRGVEAWGLDGDPGYALPEHHDGVVRTVERLVAHNRASRPPRRLAGLRFDIEPYLLRGFQGPRRGEILDGYVAVVAAAAEAAHRGGLRIGVDIPFWLDGPDEETGRPLDAVWSGRRAPVLDHLMRHADDLAIMDYRTAPGGPDGAVAHARGELVKGGEAGVGVWVGVETTELVDEDLYTFSAEPRTGLPPDVGGPWVLMAPDGDGDARVWLVRDAAAAEEVAAEVGETPRLRYWFAGRPSRVAADKQSFFRLGRESMERATAEIRRTLAESPAFLGLAFHDYVGLRRLLEGG